VIISGPPAVGKTTVAEGLAEEFNLKHLSGGDILKEMAGDEGFSPKGDDWWDTNDGMNFLDKRKTNTKFDKKVDEKLKNIFHQGGVVITSYTLPWLVNDGIKIWLSGSFENSARRMKTRDNVTESDALKVVKKRFDENKEIYKSLYNFEFGKDLSVFNKIINTDDLNAEEVLDIAKSTVRELL